MRLSASLAALLLVLAALSLAVGTTDFTVDQLLAALTGNDERLALIVYEIRLPRTLLAILIGGSLGLGGAALQGLVRNPLASPSLFGAPSAAALGAVIVISSGIAGALSFALPVAGMVGALASVGALMLLAGRNAPIIVLLLAGLVLSSFAAAGTSLALNLSPNPFAALEVAFWLLGSLEDRSFQHIWMAGPFIVVGSVFIATQARALKVMSLGEDTATSLGVNVRRLRLVLIGGVAMAVGAGVSVAGTVGFIGLVAPHLVRPLVGYDPARVLLPATLAGSCLLLAADLLVRIVPTSGEPLKVGVVTALVGAPFFLGLVLRERRALAGRATL
ncbi:iron ABC transporter permease [Ahrensia marina]|uniref:FecCD family ABC transporter permease n=1 Tax=Ahrensia marina TaxID=1514904 RepID=UPI0035CF58A8